MTEILQGGGRLFTRFFTSLMLHRRREEGREMRVKNFVKNCVGLRDYPSTDARYPTRFFTPPFTVSFTLFFTPLP
jgi:hypothetical protein